MPQITKRLVDALPPDTTIWDDKVIGFGCRRQRRDAIYIIKYRAHGKRRYETIGRHGSPWTVELARKEALKRMGAALSAPAPIAMGEPFVGVMEAYLRQAQRHQRPTSFSEISRYLRKVWAPFHDRPIASITRRDIALILDTMSGQTAVQARMSLSAMFGWALSRYDLPANPVTLTARPKGAAKRSRVLTDGELRQIWIAAGGAGDFGTVVRLLLLTGQRRNEVGFMTGEEIVGDVWTIPAGRTKNKRQHSVPLTPFALSLLPPTKSGRLFNPGSWGTSKAKFDKSLPDVAHWSLHDGRRTFRSGLGRLGVAPHIAERAVNHVRGGMEEIYDRYRYEPEIRDALSRWSDHVSALVAPHASVKK